MKQKTITYNGEEVTFGEEVIETRAKELQRWWMETYGSGMTMNFCRRHALDELTNKGE